MSSIGAVSPVRGRFETKDSSAVFVLQTPPTHTPPKARRRAIDPPLTRAHVARSYQTLTMGCVHATLHLFASRDQRVSGVGVASRARRPVRALVVDARVNLGLRASVARGRASATTARALAATSRAGIRLAHGVVASARVVASTATSRRPRSSPSRVAFLGLSRRYFYRGEESALVPPTTASNAPRTRPDRLPPPPILRPSSSTGRLVGSEPAVSFATSAANSAGRTRITRRRTSVRSGRSRSPGARTQRGSSSRSSASRPSSRTPRSVSASACSSSRTARRSRRSSLATVA